MKKLLIVFTGLLLLNQACDKKKDSPNATLESPMQTPNGWEVIAATPIPDEKNADGIIPEYIKLHGNTLDVIFTRYVILQQGPLFFSYRWQPNLDATERKAPSEVGFRKGLVKFLVESVPPGNIRSFGLEDNQLLALSETELFYVKNPAQTIETFGEWRNGIFFSKSAGQIGENSFAFQKTFVGSAGATLAKVMGKKGDIYLDWHLFHAAAAYNTNTNELVIVSFNNGYTYYPAITISESVPGFADFNINATYERMHPVTIKNTYNMSDFAADSVVGGAQESWFYTKDNKLYFLVKYGPKTDFFEVDVHNYNLKKMNKGHIVSPTGRVSLIESRPGHFVEIVNTGGVINANYWNGSAYSAINLPVLKTAGTFYWDIFYDSESLWMFLEYDKKIYILRKKI